ncbi:MAG: hypothetical protein IPM33_03860 [Phycisphaerales bacterium]|nr:hypothetical protein [Phycisphaerales bacterium]
MNRARQAWASLGAAMIGAVLCAGCSTPKKPNAGGGFAGAPASEPFAAVTIRVHPLTHAEGPSAGQPPDRGLIVLHYELKDRYGDVVKSIGKLRVQMYKPGGAGASGVERQELAWEVADLADPDENSRRYDRTTRTYRIPLIAPAWVASWQSGGGTGLKLRVVYTVIGADASERYLEDEYVMQ